MFRMAKYQQGTSLLVPVCLLLVLVTAAVMSYSEQLRHHTISLQRDAERNNLHFSTSESLARTYHLLDSTQRWETVLSASHKRTISEH